MEYSENKMVKKTMIEESIFLIEGLILSKDINKFLIKIKPTNIPCIKKIILEPNKVIGAIKIIE